MSIFDVHISVYNGVTDNVGTVTYLSTFRGSKRHVERILALRAETDEARKRAMKLSLPAATVSGVFHPKRNDKNLVAHTGFISIDIDGKDNPEWTAENMKQALACRPDVAYAALSVSGNGVFGIIPIAYPQRHGEQFDALRQEFLIDYDLKLDKQCRDTTRLRFLSYDPEPYINEQAEVYEGVEVFQRYEAQPSRTGIRGDEEKVRICVEQLLERGIDLASDYDEWYHVAVALSNLGEVGRYYFHQVSSVNPKYRVEDTDRKFDIALREPKPYGLGSFFFWCRHGHPDAGGVVKEDSIGITYKRKQL